MAPTKVLLASPRGYCAGVDRAVDTVERALDHFGAPVYVRKEIVHNGHVVRDLSDRGAVFVDSELDVPRGGVVVLSAHGVAPDVYRNCTQRGLRMIDATCPLVTKVHTEAKRFAADGYTIVLIGHEGHEEVVGTMGEAPDAIQLIGSVEAIDRLVIEDPERIAYITQTTLSVDETVEIIAALRERYPAVVGPKKDDICYATQNRQNAVKQLAREVDLVLVIGSRNSSNSNRLVDVTREMGVASYLIDDETDIDPRWLDGVTTVGVTSGASAPEWLVERVVSYFRSLGVVEVASHELVDENVHFSLPVELRRASSVSQ
jgi:4-hydroxy-3-methylbut-2-en-1-yl diphosphate reductase